MIVRSVALMRSRKESLISLEECLSAISRTISPRCLSWSATTCLLSASTSPVAFAPVRSIALKTYVAIAYVLLRRAPGRLRGHSEAAHAAAGQAAQLLRRRRALLGHALGDLARAHELRERRIHRLHADVRAGLHRGRDLMRLALADQVADGRRRHEDLGGHDARRAVGGRDELLGHDTLERDRELHADLVLLVGGEDIDDAVDRLRRALRVERREDEVAGL